VLGKAVRDEASLPPSIRHHSNSDRRPLWSAVPVAKALSYRPPLRSAPISARRNQSVPRPSQSSSCRSSAFNTVEYGSDSHSCKAQGRSTQRCPLAVPGPKNQRAVAHAFRLPDARASRGRVSPSSEMRMRPSSILTRLPTPRGLVDHTAAGKSMGRLSSWAKQSHPCIRCARGQQGRRSLPPTKRGERQALAMFTQRVKRCSSSSPAQTIPRESTGLIDAGLFTRAFTRIKSAVARLTPSPEKRFPSASDI